MRELHLFAGIGGGVLGGMLLGHTPVCMVEIDWMCRHVLHTRMREGLIPTCPIFGDVKEFDGNAWRGRVDVVCGGFPCQPWSVAGLRKGEQDERELWPEMFRVVQECSPDYVFAENVSIQAFRRPFHDLRELGYLVPPAVEISAGDLGAPYPRKRWWLLAAKPDRRRLQARPVLERPWGEGEGARDAAHHLADADRERLAEWLRQCSDPGKEQPPVVRGPWRHAAPRLLRMVSRHAYGVDQRKSRIRALGNAQVPQVAAAAFQFLMEQLS